MRVINIPIIPVLDFGVREYCTLPYPGHKKGCPMFGKRKECPPQAPLFDKHFDMTKPIFAAICEFDIWKHAVRMFNKHPHWTDKQCRNPLYWQNSVRKMLKEFCEEFCREGLVYTLIPEAMGMDVVKTMAKADVKIEFPPNIIVRKVAIIGSPK